MKGFSFWILKAHSLLHFTRKLCISVRPWVYYWVWGRTFFWNAPKGLVEKRIPRWIIPPTPLKKSPYLFYMSPPFFGSFPDQQKPEFLPRKALYLNNHHNTSMLWRQYGILVWINNREKLCNTLYRPPFLWESACTTIRWELYTKNRVKYMGYELQTNCVRDLIKNVGLLCSTLVHHLSKKWIFFQTLNPICQGKIV